MKHKNVFLRKIIIKKKTKFNKFDIEQNNDLKNNFLNTLSKEIAMLQFHSIISVQKMNINNLTFNPFLFLTYYVKYMNLITILHAYETIVTSNVSFNCLISQTC